MKLEIKTEEEYLTLHEIISDAMRQYFDLIELYKGRASLDSVVYVEKFKKLYSASESWLERLEQLDEDSE